jgi:hypothetical protein
MILINITATYITHFVMYVAVSILYIKEYIIFSKSYISIKLKLKN